MLSRRELLRRLGSGVGALGLAQLGCAADQKRGAGQVAVTSASLRPRLVELIDELEKRFPTATALAYRRQIAWAARDGGDFALDSGADGTILIQVFDGVGWRAESTSDFSPRGAETLRDRLLEGRVERTASKRKTRDALARDLEPRGDLALATLTDEEWRQALEVLYDRMTRIGTSQTIYRGASALSSSEQTLFVGDGKNIQQSIVRLQARASFVARTAGELTEEEATQAGTGTSTLFEIPNAQLEKASRSSTAILGGKVVDSADVDVLLEPEVTAAIAQVIARELFNGRAWMSGTSAVSVMRGDQIADRRFRLTDDPTLPGGYASYDLDQEGEIAKPTELIASGLVGSPYCDKGCARALSIPTSSNGRLETVFPRASSSNLVVAPGSATKAELMAEIKNGFLLEGPSIVAVDPRRRTLMVRVRRAREIQGGSLSGRIAGSLTLRADVLGILLAVRGVGEAVERIASHRGIARAVDAPMLLTRGELRG